MVERIRVFNRTKQSLIVEEGRVASNAWTRLVGLMGTRALPQGDGLLLRHEKAIHTFGMFIPIDVLYLDGRGKVLRADAAVPPNRIGPLVRGVQDVLELPVGTFDRTYTNVGDQVEIQIL